MKEITLSQHLRLEFLLPVLLVGVRVRLGVEVVEDELRFSRI